MKTTQTSLPLAILLAATLAGCGGGSSSSTVSTVYSESVSGCIENVLPQNDPSVFCVTDDCNSTSTRISYYSADAEANLTALQVCEEEMAKWKDTYFTSSPLTSEQAEMLDYLNDIRSHMGLPVFIQNARLEEAAHNHEMYLNDVWDKYGVNETHYEDNDTYPSVYYTGDGLLDRYKYANYRGTGGAEVVHSTTGSTTIINSVKSLMTAIYHRLYLLTYKSDEIGIGGTEHGFSYPHAIGYTEKKYYLENASSAIMAYPYPSQTDVQTSFGNHETPDPLPDISESVGNPISIVFNPYKYKEVTVRSFKLYRTDTGEEVTNTRYLDKDTDPNERLDAFTYVLFPLDVMQSGTTYRAEIDYTATRLDGVEEDTVYKWEFDTEE